MRKRGLKDVKRRNRQVIIEAVMKAGSLSRIEIAQKTELAASTVSSLASELLSEGLLIEAGTVNTAGRSRTELAINPQYGSISVIEISRREVCVTWFDMTLKPIKTQTLRKRYVSGNELLTLIDSHIRSQERKLPPLAGIGLLFQEDMRESDFRVMYSTGFSSASITLKEALMTQYRLPVEEQYSVTYTVTNALAQEVDPEVRNSAHISVGSRVMASVTLEGRNIPIRSTFCDELAFSIDQEAAPHNSNSPALLPYLGRLITLLCMLFPLETIFLSGMEPSNEEAAEELRQLAVRNIPREQIPHLQFLKPAPVTDGSIVIAEQVLRQFLVSHGTI